MMKRQYKYSEIRDNYINSDKKLFDNFYYDYNNWVFNKTWQQWKKGLTKMEVEGAVQLAWAQFANDFQKNKTLLNLEDSPHQWVKAIANKKALKIYTKKKKMPTIDKEPQEDDYREWEDVLYEENREQILENIEQLDDKCRYFLIARFRLITRDYILELKQIKRQNQKKHQDLISKLKDPLPPSDKGEEYYAWLTERDIFEMKKSNINQTKSRCLIKLKKGLLKKVIDKIEEATQTKLSQ